MIKKNIFTLVFGFVLLSSFDGYAFEGKTERFVLENGLTVIVSEMPNNPMVAVYTLAKTGSASEGEYLGTGISHYLEHMVFKGTPTRGVGVIPGEIQGSGGYINASTSLDYTIYTLVVPNEEFDTALNVMTDMMMNAVIDADEVEKERVVVHGEMRMHEDRPERKMSRLAFDNIFKKHPYRHPVIGYKQLFDKITQKDLLDYYKMHYAPNNLILSIAGDVKIEDIRKKVEAEFGGYERQRYVPRDVLAEPEQIMERYHEESFAGAEITRVSMAFRGVSLLDRDLYALDVLAVILGQGASSRLYQDLYKTKGIVTSVRASNYTPVDPGAFEIEASLNYESLDAFRKSVWEHIDAIKKSGVKSKELTKAKRRVLSQYIFSNQTVSEVAWSQAVDEAFAGDYQFSKSYVDMIGRITNADIKRVVNKYFSKDRLTTVVLKPEDKESADQGEIQKVATNEIRHKCFANGSTLLVKEDHSFPIVSIQLLLQGGLRQESEEISGVANVAAKLWTKGTKKYTAKQLSELTESLGIRFGASSAKNTTRLYLEGLSEDFDLMFSLLNDLINNPTFPDKELKKIKERNLVGIQTRAENISYATGFEMKQLMFENHPYRHDVSGTEESLERITRQDVIDYFDRFLVTPNMVLSIFGDIDPDVVLNKVETELKYPQKQNFILDSFVEKAPQQPREKTVELDKQQAMVMFGFYGVELKHPDRYAMQVLTSILGSSFNGRMFSNIRDKLSYAYSLGGQYTPGPDIGYMVYYVLTDGASADKVEDLLKKEIEKLRQELVTDKELADIKKYIIGNFKSTLQTASSLSFTASLDHIYGLGYDNYKFYDQNINSVTKDDVLRLAKEYLDLNTVTIIKTIPRKQEEGE